MRPLPRPSLDDVNAIARLIRQDLSLAPCHGRMKVFVRGHSFSSSIRPDGLYFRFEAAHRMLSGTEEQAMVQVVRWSRRFYRKPLGWWAGWCGPSVGLGSPALYPALVASTYPDPERTCCVICRARNPRDWWSHGRRIGPACRGVSDGKCP